MLTCVQNDIKAMLARKSQLQAANQIGLSTLERSRLIQQRTMALRRQDYIEVEQIDAKLELAKTQEPVKPETSIDLLAKVNERNRKANMEAVRKAEIAESERKRRERKLASQGGGTSTPSDPSARLKILPRTFNSNTPTRFVFRFVFMALFLFHRRSGTPVTTGSPGPPKTNLSALAHTAGQAPVKGSSFEDSLIDSVEVDLGDF